MDEFDAYAPPKADLGIGSAKKKSKKKKLSGAISEAIERLNEHLADAGAVAHDRREAGGRLRGATIGFVVFSALAVVSTIFMLSTNPTRDWDATGIAVGAFAAFLVLITVILVVADVRILPRDKPASPEETLKCFFRAIAMARLGYAWATLCPTAREQSVETPPLGPVAVTPGTFTLQRPEDLKNYTQTFARPGNGQMRTMQIKNAVLLSEEGDVAVVEVTAVFQSWPQWAQLIAVVGFVIIRLLGAILFLILFLTLRKTHEVIFRKTLIRGSNGVWYVYSGDLLEGSTPES